RHKQQVGTLHGFRIKHSRRAGEVSSPVRTRGEEKSTGRRVTARDFRGSTFGACPFSGNLLLLVLSAEQRCSGHKAARAALRPGFCGGYIMKRQLGIGMAVALVLALGWLAAAARADDKPDPNGTWKWEVERNGQKFETTLKLKLDGDKLTGT